MSEQMISEPTGLAAGSLEHKVALVTGAGAGIGRATALALARAGADVAVVDISIGGAAETATAVKAAGRRSRAIAADLAEIDRLGPIVDDVSRRLGPIDILVNNAGIVTGEGLLDTGDDSWARSMAVNLTAPWKLLQLVGRRMIERGEGGRIVNVSSSSAFRAVNASGAYGVSKAALCALTRGAAAELGPYDVNVNAVAPGVTATAIVAAGIGDHDAQQAAVSSGPLANLLQRISQPDDVANVIVFLCLPASRQITGQVVHTSAGAVVGMG